MNSSLKIKAEGVQQNKFVLNHTIFTKGSKVYADFSLVKKIQNKIL